MDDTQNSKNPGTIHTQKERGAVKIYSVIFNHIINMSALWMVGGQKNKKIGQDMLS